MPVQKEPWDVDIDATRAAVERFARALFVVGGHFTDSFHLHPIDRPTRAVTVFVRVWIPVGKEQVFEDRAAAKLRRPPRVSTMGGA